MYHIFLQFARKEGTMTSDFIKAEQKAVGVVAEFNPFHNGHALFLQRIKENFPDKPIVCVISSDFVQRGDVAIAPSYARAKSAVLCGADLVLEIPFPFSCLSAESFARAGCGILAKIGVCDTLVFGSEIASLSVLEKTAENLASPEFQAEFSSLLASKKGIGFPRGREIAYKALFGDCPALTLPNAALGIEYLLSIKKRELPLKPFLVKREGAEHESEITSDNIASASFVRALILSGNFSEAERFLPKASAEVLREEEKKGFFPATPEKLFPSMLYLLRTLTRTGAEKLYSLGAVFDRAGTASDSAFSLEELIEKTKSFGFTESRVRRALISMLCKIPRHAEKEEPLFTRVLAANGKGRALLKEAKTASAIPIFTKPAHILSSPSTEIVRQGSAAFLAERIYALSLPGRIEANFSFRRTPFFTE